MPRSPKSEIGFKIEAATNIQRGQNENVKSKVKVAPKVKAPMNRCVKAGMVIPQHYTAGPYCRRLVIGEGTRDQKAVRHAIMVECVGSRIVAQRRTPTKCHSHPKKTPTYPTGHSSPTSPSLSPSSNHGDNTDSKNSDDIDIDDDVSLYDQDLTHMKNDGIGNKHITPYNESYKSATNKRDISRNNNDVAMGEYDVTHNERHHDIIHNNRERNEDVSANHDDVIPHGDSESQNSDDASPYDNDDVTWWMAHVQTARDCHEQNMEVFSDPRGRLFFRVLRPIAEGEELLVWYSDEFALMSGIPVITPSNITGNKMYMCPKCWQTYEYPNSLKAHMRFHCALYKHDVIDQVISSAEQTPFCLPLLSKPNIPDDNSPKRLCYTPKSHKGLYPEYLETVSPYKVKTETNNTDSPEKHSTTLPRAYVTPLQIDITDTATNIPGIVRPIQIFNHIHPSIGPIHVPRQWPYYYHPHFYSHPLNYQRSYTNYYRPNMEENMAAVNKNGAFHPMTSSLHDDDLISRVDDSSDDDKSTGSVSLEREEYRFRMPSEHDGEPLDLIPRHLYISKSRGGHLCIYCGKIYSRKYGLKIHLRTHTGYKPLKCKFCLRPFGDPSNLNKHIRLHNDGETPYRCQLCEKVLVRRRDLVRHIRSRHPSQYTDDLEAFDDKTDIFDEEEICVDIKSENLTAGPCSG